MSRKREKTWNLKIEDNLASRLVGAALLLWAATPIVLGFIAR